MARPRGAEGMVFIVRFVEQERLVLDFNSLPNVL